MNIEKKALIIIGFFALLTACTTVQGLRNDAPSVMLNSAKAPSEVGHCIAAGWGEFYGVTINQSPTVHGGYTVNMPNIYTGNNGVADVTPSDPGSTVRIYYRLSKMGGYVKFTNVAKSCV